MNVTTKVVMEEVNVDDEHKDAIEVFFVLNHVYIRC